MWSFYLTLLICITKEKRKHYTHKNQRRHFPVVFVLIAELRILPTVSKDLKMMKDFCSWSVCLSVCLSVCPSVRPSVRPFVHSSVSLSVHSSVHPSVSVHPYVRPSVLLVVQSFIFRLYYSNFLSQSCQKVQGCVKLSSVFSLFSLKENYIGKVIPKLFSANSHQSSA